MASTKEGGAIFQLHPLVLVSISDHITRIRSQGGPETRVVGCLLGLQSARTVEITNAFELKSSMQGGALVIDKEYMQLKQEQCAPFVCVFCFCGRKQCVCVSKKPEQAAPSADKRVFPKYEVMGWYSSGSSLLDGDLVVHKMARTRVHSLP